MTQPPPTTISILGPEDPPAIAAAFAAVGWHKSRQQFESYLAEQTAGARVVFVARCAGEIAGYLTLVLRADYRYLDDRVIPEVRDFNVLPRFRRQGIGSRLMDRVEAEAARHDPVLGIGVGLHAGYGSAQRMYVRRGYIPDGRGLVHDDRHVPEGRSVPNDDDLVLCFTKVLR